MNKNYLNIGLGIGAAVLIMAGVVYYLSPFNKNPSPNTATTTSDLTASTTPVAPSGGGVITATEVWALFGQYKTGLKNHDLVGLNKLFYKPQSCPPKDCTRMMDFGLAVANQLKLSDFVHVWADDRQIILMANPVRHESETEIEYTQASLFVIKDSTGALKFIAINPSRVWTVKKASLANPDAYLLAQIKDSDQDGLTDVEEIKTDPHNRDSNGNGWWDGIEAGF